MGGHFQNEDGSLNRLKRIKRCKPNAMAFTVFKQEVCIEIWRFNACAKKKEREHTFAFLLTNSSTKLPTIITSPGRPACHLWSILAHNTLLVSSLLVAIPAHVRQSSPPHHQDTHWWIIFWETGVHPSSLFPETYNVPRYIEVVPVGLWWPSTLAILL